MSKILDKLIFSALFIALVYGLSSPYLGKSGATALTAAAHAAAVLLYTALKVRRSLAKEITPQDMCALLALMGADKQTKLIYSTIPEESREQIKPPYFVFEKEGKRYMVAVLYKFLNLTQEDISAAYRAALNLSANRIIILSRARDRKTVNLGGMLPMEILYPDKRTVYKYLRKHNALPKPLVEKNTTRKVPVDWGYLAEAVFDKSKLKYYLFTSILLVLTAFLTPLRIYYLISATLPLAMSAICLIRSAVEKS